MCPARNARSNRFETLDIYASSARVQAYAKDASSGVHSKHSFVMKRDVTDSWIPAIRENERKEHLRPELITDLQNRELSNNDYELLLQLDQLEKFPIQDYLMTRLGGQKIGAENTKALGEPGGTCTICRQSLKIRADIRSIPTHFMKAVCRGQFCRKRTYVHIQIAIMCCFLVCINLP
uniref:Uncharacterized protein n=1 Tax=Globisporangium ultimum (strain ATCC 200006 / CBS 805.95 / DAOM BR144) TaxID=431595 RepID=K3WLR9_GLOUD